MILFLSAPYIVERFIWTWNLKMRWNFYRRNGDAEGRTLSEPQRVFLINIIVRSLWEYLYSTPFSLWGVSVSLVYGVVGILILVFVIKCSIIKFPNFIKTCTCCERLVFKPTSFAFGKQVFNYWIESFSIPYSLPKAKFIFVCWNVTFMLLTLFLFFQTSCISNFHKSGCCFHLYSNIICSLKITLSFYPLVMLLLLSFTKYIILKIV